MESKAGLSVDRKLRPKIPPLDGHEGACEKDTGSEARKRKHQGTSISSNKKQHPEVIDLCKNYDLPEVKQQLFQSAETEQLIGSLIGSTGLSFGKKKLKSFNQSTAIFIFYFSKIVGVANPHEVFTTKVSGYSTWINNSATFGISLQPILQEKLNEKIDSMHSYNRALLEERDRVVENVLGESPSTKSPEALTSEAWDMLTLSSTIYHSLRYALDCKNTNNRISFWDTFKIASQMTEDCLSKDQYCKRAKNILLALSTAVGQEPALSPALSKRLENCFGGKDPARKALELGKLIDNLAQHIRGGEAEAMASHIKILKKAGSRKLSKKNLSNNGKGEEYFTLWLPTIAVGFYTRMVFPSTAMDIKKSSDSKSSDSESSDSDGRDSASSDSDACDSDDSDPPPLKKAKKPKPPQPPKPKPKKAPTASARNCPEVNNEQEQEVQYHIPSDQEWKRYQEEHGMQCWLHVETERMIIKLNLSKQETYCISHLCHYNHGRQVWHVEDGLDTPNKRKSFHLIHEDVPEMTSVESPVVQVARPFSPIWDRLASTCPSWDPLFPTFEPTKPNLDLSFFINATIAINQKSAKKDQRNLKRTEKTIQVGFGFVNRMRQWCGFPLLEKCMKLTKEQKRLYLMILGRICEYVYANMEEMQTDTSKEPLCPDLSRDSRYAAHFREKLQLPQASKKRKDSAFVTITPLGPKEVPNNIDHKDKSNPQDEGYHETGCFSQVVTVDGHEMFLFQVILASWRWIAFDCQNDNHIYDQIEEQEKQIEEDNQEQEDVDEEEHGKDEKKDKSEEDENDEEQEESENNEADLHEEEDLLALGEHYDAFVDNRPMMQLEFQLQLVNGWEEHPPIYTCQHIPFHLLAPLVQYYDSDIFKEKFENATGIIHYDNQGKEDGDVYLGGTVHALTHCSHQPKRP
ncbi:unnamed protein product [Cylindrotheca closterium]|uniref:Uncharacterized protein n=1 Tax=Cylindrotheca closterium TaxID=2856 RepID=A0AAD2CX64_9STRA|nr:unnamed protein product [Cylindrotheca closterium]